MNDIDKKVEEKIKFYLREKNNNNLLLMISGGIDSMVLFNILNKLHKRKKINLSLLHCNYNINENALKAEELCKKLSDISIISAYSSGVDSTTLSYILSLLKIKYNFKLELIHFNHN